MLTRKIPQIVKEWCASIQERNPQLMGSFYSNDAVLLATYEALALGKAEILDYFNSFLDKKDLQCTITENITQMDNDRDVVIASGFYTFSFIDVEGDKQSVDARYSFVCMGNRIVNHHSSEKP